MPFTTDDPLVRVLALPFDSGVGAGRNALIDAVTTEYLWMADDDMVVLPDLHLTPVLAYLDRNPEVDLVGGRVVNLPLGRTADYSAAALYAYDGPPRLPEGALVDGLPVYYKVPNFYVARTASVRAVRYDDRLKRVDHNDFFTSAYGRLVCTYDRALVCLHAHSHFDTRYQRFRMDFAADLAHIATKWQGRGVSRAATAGGVTDTALRAFHHAALQVVADDLGVRVVHGGPDAEPRVGVPAADGQRYLAALRQVGWSGQAGRLTHRLWGAALVDADALVGDSAADADAPAEAGARVAASPTDAARTSGTTVPAHAVPAAFAGVAGRAFGAGEWPEPIRQPDATGPGDGSLHWADRVGWYDEPERISVASLPLGPVVALEPPADAIWQAVGPAGALPDDVVAAVLAEYPDAPPEAADQIRAALADLTARGLLRVG